MSKHQAQPIRFTSVQIALWLVGFILVTGNATLIILDRTHWLQNDWLRTLRHLALPVGLLCFGLTRSRRLFGPETPLRLDVVALLQRHGAQHARRVAVPAAFAFAFGAWLGKIDVPWLALLFTGLWVTLVIGIGMNLWLTRRGAPLPAPARETGLPDAHPTSHG